MKDRVVLITVITWSSSFLFRVCISWSSLIFILAGVEREIEERGYVVLMKAHLYEIAALAALSPNEVIEKGLVPHRSL